MIIELIKVFLELLVTTGDVSSVVGVDTGWTTTACDEAGEDTKEGVSC